MKITVLFPPETGQNHSQDVLTDEEMIGERVEYADVEYYLKRQKASQEIHIAMKVPHVF